MRAALGELRGPFRQAGRPNWPVIVLFALINGLVMANAVLQDPRQGYDAADHLNYIKTLAVKHTIPSCTDTGQCYVPPLPYLLPAIVLSTGHLTLWQAAKFAQLVDVLLSLGLTYYLLKICDALKPGNGHFKIASLALLGIIPLYYKTFALVRGEPYLAFLFVFASYLLLAIFALGRTGLPNILSLGLVVGFCILARQWGFLLVPAIFLLAAYSALRDHTKIQAASHTVLACLLMPLLVAGWYYVVMHGRYGTWLAAGWDRRPGSSSQASLPLSFYIGLGSGQLFKDPVRPNFDNQLPAIFYSDTWGDYGAYFLIYGRDRASGAYVSGKFLEQVIRAGPPLPPGLETNWYTFSKYLGRVNLVSLFPTGVLLGGLAFAIGRVISSLRPGWRGGMQSEWVFALLVVGCSVAGYLWYLVRYQINGEAGDLIKAVHMIQIFPLLALLAGGALEGLRSWRPRLWTGLMVALGIVCLHNLPAMITHYALVR